MLRLTHVSQINCSPHQRSTKFTLSKNKKMFQVPQENISEVDDRITESYLEFISGWKQSFLTTTF